MAKVIKVTDRFINIRGTFKVELPIGAVDVGTQTSLVQRNNGKWLMLDSLKLDDQVKTEVDALTDGGKEIEAVLNLHPFHTVFCEWVHQTYPDAKLYGSARHHSKFPQLPWQAGLLEDPATQEQFADDLDLRVPDGVDFISSNESIHFSSVVAYHAASKTIHVDDTFMFVPLPDLAKIFGFREGTVQLHPHLAGALQQRKGSVEEFKKWIHKLVNDWRDAESLCAAHSGNLLGVDNIGDSIASRIEAALTVAEPVLAGYKLAYEKQCKS
eukprot:TRINITY_DN18270_c0_g1_i4.p2 TRINITY_DN18270_c0_g1~~TRINITY_DN18270_c0_g1_i4.p2  ORF type:complete len:269 (-),score=36.20 TRINITY_DN18270_c0_g1_i4:123-929(-)